MLDEWLAAAESAEWDPKMDRLIPMSYPALGATGDTGSGH